MIKTGIFVVLAKNFQGETVQLSTVHHSLPLVEGQTMFAYSHTLFFSTECVQKFKDHHTELNSQSDLLDPKAVRPETIEAREFLIRPYFPIERSKIVTEIPRFANQEIYVHLYAPDVWVKNDNRPIRYLKFDHQGKVTDFATSDEFGLTKWYPIARMPEIINYNYFNELLVFTDTYGN